MANTLVVRDAWTGTKRISAVDPVEGEDWGEVFARREEYHDQDISTDFQDELFSRAEKEFGLDAGVVEVGIRLGLPALPEVWNKPLFDLAAKIGESFGLDKSQVRQELEKLLQALENVRWMQS